MKIRILLMFICLALIAVTGVGCATSRDSDMPWNAPASWEGSPYIPGFSE